MRRNLRLLALAVPMTFLALASAQGGPAPLGTCRTYCVMSGTFTQVVYTTTQASCCSADPNPCPPGAFVRAMSWNGSRC